MRKFNLAALAASTILTIAASSAMAQTTPSFRVPIGNENAQSDLPAAYAWLETIGNCYTTCGTGTRTTSCELSFT